MRARLAARHRGGILRPGQRTRSFRAALRSLVSRSAASRAAIEGAPHRRRARSPRWSTPVLRFGLPGCRLGSVLGVPMRPMGNRKGPRQQLWGPSELLHRSFVCSLVFKQKEWMRAVGRRAIGAGACPRLARAAARGPAACWAMAGVVRVLRRHVARRGGAVLASFLLWEGTSLAKGVQVHAYTRACGCVRSCMWWRGGVHVAPPKCVSFHFSGLIACTLCLSSGALSREGSRRPHARRGHCRRCLRRWAARRPPCRPWACRARACRPWATPAKASGWQPGCHRWAPRAKAARCHSWAPGARAARFPPSRRSRSQRPAPPHRRGRSAPAPPRRSAGRRRWRPRRRRAPWRDSRHRRAQRRRRSPRLRVRGRPPWRRPRRRQARWRRHSRHCAPPPWLPRPRARRPRRRLPARPPRRRRPHVASAVVFACLSGRRGRMGRVVMATTPTAAADMACEESEKRRRVLAACSLTMARFSAYPTCATSPSLRCASGYACNPCMASRRGATMLGRAVHRVLLFSAV